VNCYACANEATSQCKRCGRLYCDEHGDDLCAECLKPASALPSYTLYRGSLLALLVGSAFAIWLLVRPPGGSEVSSPAALGPGKPAAEEKQTPEVTAAPQLTRTGTPARGLTPTPSVAATPRAGTEYTVQEGDTLYGIAETFVPADEDVTSFVLQIVALNSLGDPSQLDAIVLRPGQVLNIP